MEFKRTNSQKLKISSCKQGKEENIFAINKDQYLKAVKFLNEKGQYEVALLIYIMGSLVSRSNEMLTFRFEDFEDKNVQKNCIVLCKQKESKEKIYYFRRIIQSSNDV